MSRFGLAAHPAGVAITGGIASLVVRSARDSAVPAGLALAAGLVLAQIAIVGVHRLHGERDGRTGRAAAILAVAGPLGLAVAIGLFIGQATWAAGAAVFVVSIVAIWLGWLVFGVAIAAGNLVRPAAGITLLWATLVLLLVEPWSARLLFGLPFGFAWLLIGWQVWQGRDMEPAPAASPGPAIKHAARAGRNLGSWRGLAALAAGCVVATAGIAGAARLAGREAGIPGAAPTGATHVVVIDSDVQPDDWLAITYLLVRPDVSVRAITVTGTGPLGCEDGVRLVLRLIALAKADAIPVACGAEHPLAGSHGFPPQWRADLQALVRRIPLPEPAANPAAGPATSPPAAAAEILRAAIAGVNQPLTIVALGPLTNVATLLQRQTPPSQSLERIVMMGGALEVGGNVGGDRDAVEWNFFVDPTAADAVFRSGVPLTLVPLDATSDVPVTAAFADRIRATAGSAAATFAGNLLDAQRDWISAGGYFFWDPLAAVALTDGRVAGFVDRRLVVRTDESLESGRVVVSTTGPSVRVAVSADAAAFERTFLESLTTPAR